MHYRPFGETNEHLSIVAMGGIVVMGVEQAEADRRTAEAVDRGINYFDVAPSYGDAEERLGPALEPYRKDVFLACKTAKRTKEEAAAELRETLTRLRTDHVDLYQLHAVSSVEEAQICLGPGGAIEAFREARNAGQVRYLGFSAHSAEAAVLLLDQFPFDSVLFPVNYTTWHNGFGPQVMQKAIEKPAARLALKAMARRPWPDGADKSVAQNTWYEPHLDPREAELALRWTLSQPITAAVPPGDPNLFRMAMDFADRFNPLTADEMALVAQRARENKPLFTLSA